MNIKCQCNESDKTGQTSVMCCNCCGLPDEDFWTNQGECSQRSDATEDQSGNEIWETKIESLIKKAVSHAKRHSYELNVDSYRMGAEDLYELIKIEPRLPTPETKPTEDVYRWVKASENNIPKDNAFEMDDYDRQCIRIKIDGNKTITTGYYDHEEKRWYYWNDEEIKEDEIEWLEKLPIPDKGDKEYWEPEIINGFIQIDIDKRTLPKDGQYIRFITETEDEHEGYFVGGEDVFSVSDSVWFFKWNVHQWKAIEQPQRIIEGL